VNRVTREWSRTESLVAVGIVNFNGAEATLAALDAVTSQIGADQCLIVIVDNASDAADLATLRQSVAGRARIVTTLENRGFAAACNTVAGIALNAGARYVWFLNNDITMDDGVLALLVACLEADGRVAAAAPATVDWNSPDTVLAAGATITLWRGRAHQRFARESVEALPTRPFDVDAIEGSAPMIRVAALEAVGAWAEGFFMYWEDTEWSVRATRLGWRLRVEPNARIRHQVSASSPPAIRIQLMLRNRVRFMRLAARRQIHLVFLLYFLILWLPAYFLTRLVPRFGFRTSIQIAAGGLEWNIRDAMSRRRWVLRREDQDIPRFSDLVVAERSTVEPPGRPEAAGVRGAAIDDTQFRRPMRKQKRRE
jgi:GT2 family glycosyltransferase